MSGSWRRDAPSPSEIGRGVGAWIWSLVGNQGVGIAGPGGTSRQRGWRRTLGERGWEPSADESPHVLLLGPFSLPGCRSDEATARANRPRARRRERVGFQGEDHSTVSGWEPADLGRVSEKRPAGPWVEREGTQGAQGHTRRSGAAGAAEDHLWRAQPQAGVAQGSRKAGSLSREELAGEGWDASHGLVGGAEESTPRDSGDRLSARRRSHSKPGTESRAPGVTTGGPCAA